MNTLDNITTIGSTLNFCDTHNHHNRKFRFTVINTGDAYGKDLCLINDKAPMVEVWDITESRTTQMVSRYYISTLLGFDEWSHSNVFLSGLVLQGNEPAWSLSAYALIPVRLWLLQIADALGIKPEQKVN